MLAICDPDLKTVRSRKTVNLTEYPTVLRPSQFRVNQTWIAFQVNTTPIPTETDGDFDCLVVMDAASCLILSQTLWESRESEPSALAIQRLIAEARAHSGQPAETLFIPSGRFTTRFPAEAERQGISVKHVPEDELMVYIGEARQAFEEYFGGGL